MSIHITSTYDDVETGTRIDVSVTIKPTDYTATGDRAEGQVETPESHRSDVENHRSRQALPVLKAVQDALEVGVRNAVRR